MFDRFTEDAKRALSRARQEALRLQHDCIDVDHLLLGLLRQPLPQVVELLAAVGADAGLLLAEVDLLSMPGHAGDLSTQQLPFTPAAIRALQRMMELAAGLQQHYCDGEHLLVAVVDVAKSPLAEAIRDAGIGYEALVEELGERARDREELPEPFTCGEATAMLNDVQDELAAWADAADEAGRADAATLLLELRVAVQGAAAKLEALSRAEGG